MFWQFQFHSFRRLSTFNITAAAKVSNGLITERNMYVVIDPILLKTTSKISENKNSVNTPFCIVKIEKAISLKKIQG